MQGVSGKVISLDSLPELVRILGKKTGNKLGELGLESVEDLLHHYPRRYAARGDLTPLHHGEEGEYLTYRSEEHTSELQSRGHLVCRLLLEKKNNKTEKPAHNNE